MVMLKSYSKNGQIYDEAIDEQLVEAQIRE